MRHGDLDTCDITAGAWREAGTERLTQFRNEREPDLLRLARNGDARAFAELAERHRGRLVAVAWRLTSDPVVAEELAQEALVRLHRQLGSFREDAALSTWLYRVVVNLSHDHRRSMRHDQTDSLDLVARMPSNDPKPDDAAEAAERARVLDAIVQSLPAAMREAVVLRYAGGLGYEEIAATLGCAPGTVASRIHRALRVIGAVLETRGLREDSL